MYSVYENNNAAVLENSYDCWKNNHFNSFSEALTYARKWLGPLFGGSEDGSFGVELILNIPYCFYHSDDCEMWIEIREE